MTDTQLKFWSGHLHHKRHFGFPLIHLAAFTLDDAVQLYKQMEGDVMGVRNQLQNYWSKRWGTPMMALVPTPRRGIYLTDDHCKSVMFIEPLHRTTLKEAPAELQAAAAVQPVPENYGRLHVGFSRGVKIDTWKYSSPHADRAYADQMTAEVRMQHSDRRGRVVDQTGVEFTAESKCWNGTLRSANIETLFKLVEKEFQTYEMGQRGIIWEDWLEILINPETGYREHDASAGLLVCYKKLKRGIDPRDRKAYTIMDNGQNIIVPFPSPKKAGQKDPDKEERGIGGRNTDHQYAYLPATAENIAAIDHVLAKITELRGRLEGLLHQDVIAAQLASIPGQLLLAEKKS